MNFPKIFTAGHSNKSLDSFLKLLQANGIQVVVDVRSAPYSRFVPQFNKKEVKAAVHGAGMKYIFMGNVIGGKPSDPHFLGTDGRVLYAKLAEAESFQQGLDRLAKGLHDGWIIVLMCAEEDPLRCHRHHLIASELERKRHIPVYHLRSDGTRIRAKETLEKHDGQMALF